jgi:hypothetical protein
MARLDHHLPLIAECVWRLHERNAAREAPANQPPEVPVHRNTLVRRLTLLFAILVFLLQFHGQGGGQTPKAAEIPPGLGLPELKGDDDLARATGSLNLALRDQYRELVGKRGHGINVAAAASSLADHLDELVKKDPALKKLGQDGIDGVVRRSTERDRVQAFIHAWASFSLLAAAADTTGVGTTPLVALSVPANKPSVLSLLLALADQIVTSGNSDKAYKKAEHDARGRIDLLQFRLADGDLFPIELACRQEWSAGEKKPAFLNHDRYIPSFDDLVGSPDDSPEPKRDLLSLWGLVNLRVDRGGRESAARGGEEAEGLGRVAAWLTSLRGHPAMKVFQAATVSQPSIGDRLTTPLARIEAFLRFREAVTQPATLAGTAELLAKFRREAPAKETQYTPVRPCRE